MVVVVVVVAVCGVTIAPVSSRAFRCVLEAYSVLLKLLLYSIKGYNCDRTADVDILSALERSPQQLSDIVWGV